MAPFVRIISALIISLLSCSVFSIPAKAQNDDDLKDSYHRFIQLTQDNPNQEGSFLALYDCFSKAKSITDATQPGTPRHMQALNILSSIAEYFPNVASYFNQKGNRQKTAQYAAAFIDIALTQGMGKKYIEHQRFSDLAYYAGAVYYADKNYNKAAKYIDAFIKTVDSGSKLTSHIPDAFFCLAGSFEAIGDSRRAIEVYHQFNSKYPSNYEALASAINYCQKIEDRDNLQIFLNRAITLKPDDKTLQLIQGQLYEDRCEFEKALVQYDRLYQTNPNDVTVVKHLAMVQYNLGVLNYNSSLINSDYQTAEIQKQKSHQYFTSAIANLRDILSFDPTLLQYTHAIGIAYSCTGDIANLEKINRRLVEMGAGRIPVDTPPVLMSDNAPKEKNSGIGAEPKKTTAIPLFSEYAKAYIERYINNWQQKDPYETKDEYLIRVTPKNRDEKIAEARINAEKEYIRAYSRPILHSEVILNQYDADNGSFLVDSPFGQMVVPVPRENHEARIFESNWMSIELVNPEFCIVNDKLALSSLTFATPLGKNYYYDNSHSAEYSYVNLDMQFEEIDPSLLASNPGSSSHSSSQKISSEVMTVGRTSDVDIDIPVSAVKHEDVFAVIIANENYQRVSHVEMAANDGKSFAAYCEKTLGIPRTNIRMYEDASFGNMLSAIADIRSISINYKGEIDIIFYYAGHGIPNETTTEAYLLPVDSDGRNTVVCYPLSKLYEELETMGARRTVVFLDACFSGSGRGDGMLASARGVARKVKEEMPRGNMLVFSAASGDETAYPYLEKSHGLFTYFLLKGLKNSAGDITMGDLTEYVLDNVKKYSVVNNRKSQTPVVSPSINASGIWKNWKLH